jgi:hypothetical protein
MHAAPQRCAQDPGVTAHVQAAAQRGQQAQVSRLLQGGGGVGAVAQCAPMAGQRIAPSGRPRGSSRWARDNPGFAAYLRSRHEWAILHYSLLLEVREVTTVLLAAIEAELLAR